LEHGNEITVNQEIMKSGKNHRDEGDKWDLDLERESDSE
jgi:hypothetical protein